MRPGTRPPGVAAVCLLAIVTLALSMPSSPPVAAAEPRGDARADVDPASPGPEGEVTRPAGEGVNLDEAEIERQLAWRQSYGFRSDRAHLDALVSRSELRARGDVERESVLLTPEEFTEVQRRTELGQAFSSFQRPLRDMLPPDALAGIWQDHSDGGRVVVALTPAHEHLADEVRAAFDHPEGLRIDVRQVRLDQLEAVHDRAQDLRGTLHIEWIRVDEVGGVVYLRTSQTWKPRHRERIRAHFPEPFVVLEDQVEVRKGGDLTRHDPWTPLRGGLVLRPTSGRPGACSSGPTLRRSNAFWISTAGHCGEPGEHFSQGGRNLNPLDFVQVAGQTDRALIAIPGAVAGTQVYEAPNFHPDFNDWLRNTFDDYEGMRTCISAGWSDHVHCGEVIDRFGTKTDVQGRQTTNQRVVQFVGAIEGDSGSPFYSEASRRVVHGTLSGNCDGHALPCNSNIARFLLELGSGWTVHVRFN